MNKWNICSTNFYKTYENSKFTVSKLRSETKNMSIWKPLYEKSLTPPKGLTSRSDGFGLRILVFFFLTRAKQKNDRGVSFGTEKRGGFQWKHIHKYQYHTLFIFKYLSTQYYTIYNRIGLKMIFRIAFRYSLFFEWKFIILIILHFK